MQEDTYKETEGLEHGGMGLAQYIELGGLHIEVRIVEKRTRFGFKQYRVVPVAGAGEKWINENSLLYPAPLKVIKNK